MNAPSFARLVLTVLSLSLVSCASYGPRGSEERVEDGMAYEAPMPDPNLEETASLDGIMRAVYDVISGPKGQARDWNRFMHLFHPDGAQLQFVSRGPAGQPKLLRLTPDEYQVNGKRMFAAMGFFERETGRSVQRFGSIAQVFSSFESRKEVGGEPFDSGINSFQLYWDGTRWYVLSILWDIASDDRPIPAEYLR